MGAKTKIEWADASWTPIRARFGGNVGHHCEHVSEGCRNCYAESMNKRLGTGLEFKPGYRDKIDLFLDEKMLQAPLHWRKPRMIFVCSMTDLFADFVPDEWIIRILGVMAQCKQHTFQVLTKRPMRMRQFMTNLNVALTCHAGGNGYEWTIPNLWIGTSCENQPAANARIPDLLATPAAVRFVSCEPMLGPIDLQQWLKIGDEYSTINWVIVGGESGHGARQMHPDWARSLRDQCAAASVPFFMKQMTKKALIPDDLMMREFPEAKR